MQTLLEGAVAQPNDAPGTRDRNRLRIEVDRWQGVCAPSVDANTDRLMVAVQAELSVDNPQTLNHVSF